MLWQVVNDSLLLDKHDNINDVVMMRALMRLGCCVTVVVVLVMFMDFVLVSCICMCLLCAI